MDDIKVLLTSLSSWIMFMLASPSVTVKRALKWVLQAASTARCALK